MREPKDKYEKKGDLFDEAYKDAPSSMDRLERKPKSRFTFGLIVTIIFLLLIAIATVAGFLVFNEKNDLRRGESVEINITSPDKATSGEKIVLEVEYKNKSGNVGLKSGELNMTYPEGFYADNSKSDWQLGEIGAGKSGVVRIEGRLIGEIGTSKKFEADFVYRPENFNYDFEVNSEKDILINASAISLEITALDKAISGEEVELTYKIKNNSSEEIAKIKSVIGYPAGFSFKESAPPPSEGNNTWFIEQLGPGQEAEFKIKGVVEGEDGEYQNFKISISVENEDKVYNLQQEASKMILTVKPEMSLEMSINGSDQGLVAELGSKLDYKIVCKNASDLLAKNIVLSVEFDQNFAILDFSSFKDEASGELNGQKIVWDYKTNKALVSLEPDKEATISFSIKTNRSVTDGKNLKLKTIAKIESYEVSGLDKTAKLPSYQITLEAKFKTKVDLDAKGLYYDDKLAQIGEGPHPPKVGEKTVYQIIVSLKDITGDLENTKFEAYLPEGIVWASESSSSSGSFSYEVKERKIVWDLGKISAKETPQAKFKISLTPTSKDLGKVMTLVKDLKLEALDSFVDQKIELVDDEITTKLEEDQLGSGNGKVRP